MQSRPPGLPGTAHMSIASVLQSADVRDPETVRVVLCTDTSLGFVFSLMLVYKLAKCTFSHKWVLQYLWQMLLWLSK